MNDDSRSYNADKAEMLLENDPASKLLGITIAASGKDSASLTMRVTEEMTNGYDICHGGFVYTLADTAAAFAAADHGQTILTASNQIDYLLPAKLGDYLEAKSRVDHEAGRQLFCKVEVCNQEGSLIALLHSKLIKKG